MQARYRKRARSDDGEDEYAYSYTGPKRTRGRARTPYTSANVRNSRPLPYRTYSKSMVPSSSRGYVLNDVELKAYDEVGGIPPNYIIVGNNYPMSALFIPIIGAEINQRIGRKCTVKSIFIRGLMQTYASGILPMSDAVVTSLQGRILVIWDSQPNGLMPAAADILEAPLNTNSQLNLDYRDRFRILADECMIFDPFILQVATGICSAPNQIHKFKIYKKMNDQVIFNSTNGGTYADIATGNIILMWVGDTASGSPDIGLRGTYTSRIRYSDA